MRKILLSATVSLLLGTPAFAGTAATDDLSSDPEVRQVQEWDLLVAKANAERLTRSHDSAAARDASTADAQRGPARGATQPSAAAGN